MFVSFLFSVFCISSVLSVSVSFSLNNDDPFFFDNVFNTSSYFECEEIILGGDFNLVLNAQKDKKGGSPVTHEKSLQKVKFIFDSLDLTDIWRFLNADTKRFTWRRRNPQKQCRPDFF